jgi:hypothetical protein
MRLCGCQAASACTRTRNIVKTCMHELVLSCIDDDAMVVITELSPSVQGPCLQGVRGLGWWWYLL